MLSLFFFFSSYVAHRDLPSFPTRRSSDLEGGERVDVPEGAHEERVLRLPEIVLLDVTEDEVAVAQLALDRAHGAGDPGVVRGQEAHLDQPQQARVESVAVRGRHEAALLGIPAPLADELVNPRRLAAP